MFSQASQSHLALPDKCGNTIMTLRELGLDAVIRFVRLDGSIWFSGLDTTMAVTGKNNMQAGESLFLSKVCGSLWKLVTFQQACTNLILGFYVLLKPHLKMKNLIRGFYVLLKPQFKNEKLPKLRFLFFSYKS